MLQAKVGAFTFVAVLNHLVGLRVSAPNRYFSAMPLPVFSFTLPIPAAWPGVLGVCGTACALVRRP